MTEIATAPPTSSLRARRTVVVATLVLGLAALALSGPIGQPQAYHAFADARTLGGVPNAMDVLSNLAFLVSGIHGLRVVSAGRAVVRERWEALGWAIVFAGVVATSVGSAWYHIAPDDASLAWDRLPMMVVFAAFAALVAGERGAPALGRALLAPLLVVGIASVVVWRVTGDLRMYAAMQYLPMPAMVLALLLLPGRYDRSRELWFAFACYGVAKAGEALDAPVFELTGFVSGHTVKHLAAALAPFFFVQYVTRRRPTDAPHEVSPCAR